ncbi:MAG: hypothetical protein ACYCUI_14570, partial [Vulcanimicrobiaceae bacterium]
QLYELLPTTWGNSTFEIAQQFTAEWTPCQLFTIICIRRGCGKLFSDSTDRQRCNFQKTNK